MDRKETDLQFEFRLARMIARPVFWDVFHLTCLAVLAALLFLYAPLWGWSCLLWIPCVVGWWVASVVLVGLAYHLPTVWEPLMNLLPRHFQRTYYEVTKERLKRLRISPIVDFPFQAYIDFNLDQEFEKGGFNGASKACDAWLAEYPKRLTNALTEITKLKDKVNGS